MAKTKGDFLEIVESIYKELSNQDKRITNNYKRIQSINKKLKGRENGNT